MTDDTYRRLSVAAKKVHAYLNDAMVGAGRDDEELASGLFMDAISDLAPFLTRGEFQHIASVTKFRDEQ